MPKTAKDWRLYVPTCTGAFDCPLPVCCGDISDVVDSEAGDLETDFQLDIRTGRHYSVWRHRKPRLGEITLQVAEETAGGIDKLRNQGCLSYIQRRRICAGSGLSGDWDLVEHYSRVNYAQRGLTAATAQGIDVRDDVPSVEVEGFYESRTMLDKRPPTIYINDIDEPLRPIDVVYCDDVSCGYFGRSDIRGSEEAERSNPPSDGCQIMFALYDVITPAPDAFLLEKSDDGGTTWVPVSTDIPASGFHPDFLFCHFGRLFIGLGEEIYFSDDAAWNSPSTWTRVTAFNEVTQVGGNPPITMIPLGSGGRVIAMASSQDVIYALYSDGTNDNGVARCFDDQGSLFEPVFPATPDRGTYFDIDTAGYGTVVAVCGYGDDGFGNQVGEIAFNYVFGTQDLRPILTSPITWFTQQYSGPEFGQDPSFRAISLASYNPNYNRTVFAWVWNSHVDPITGVTINSIMKSKDLAGFREIFRHEEAFLNNKRPHLRNALDGSVVWAYRPSFSSEDTIILKSIDGGCSWVRFEDDRFLSSLVVFCAPSSTDPNALFLGAPNLVEMCNLIVGSQVCVVFADGTVKIATVTFLPPSPGDIGIVLQFTAPILCADNGGPVAVTCKSDSVVAPCTATNIIFDGVMDLCKHNPNVAYILGAGIESMPPCICPPPEDFIDPPPEFLP